MMQKVIAAKKKSDLSVHPYYSYNKYQKLTFALNEVSDKVFEDGAFRKVPFMKDHVEICPETGKKILPISVDETVTQQIYRKDPKAQKQIILGQQSTGINDLFSTGDILTTLIKDCLQMSTSMTMRCDCCNTRFTARYLRAAPSVFTATLLRIR